MNSAKNILARDIFCNTTRNITEYMPTIRNEGPPLSSFRCPIDLYEVNVQRDIRLRHAVAASRACRIILRNVPYFSLSLSSSLDQVN